VTQQVLLSTCADDVSCSCTQAVCVM
jgi:hypothetical protein